MVGLWTSWEALESTNCLGSRFYFYLLGSLANQLLAFFLIWTTTFNNITWLDNQLAESTTEIGTHAMETPRPRNSMHVVTQTVLDSWKFSPRLCPKPMTHSTAGVMGPEFGHLIIRSELKNQQTQSAQRPTWCSCRNKCLQDQQPNWTIWGNVDTNVLSGSQTNNRSKHCK